MNNETELFEELEFFEKEKQEEIKEEVKELTPEEKLSFTDRQILENWWNRLWNMEV